MPSAAMVSGTNRVMMEAYASGNDVHRTTKMKISQTWLPSHTGPIERSITLRGRCLARPRRRSGPRTLPRSRRPEHRVRHHGQQEHDGDCGAHRTASSSSSAGTDGTSLAVWRVVLGEPSGSPEPPAHPAQDEDRRHAEREIDDGATNVIQTPVLPVAASSTFM